MDETVILVAFSNQIAFLKVLGKGSFINAKRVKSFYEDCLRQGATRVLLDLGQCSHMDSTFMGILAAIAAEQKRLDYSKPMILNLTPRNRELLDTLGLNRVLDIPEHAPEDMNTELIRLEAAHEATKEESAQVMLDAHEELIQLDDRNRTKFRDVVEYLREKLDSSHDS